MIYGNYLRNKYNNAAVKLADAEGVPCIMEYSKYKNIRNYEIYGNSVQNGTPSPDNPVEVESVGDFSKNLFDMDSCDYHGSGRKGESIIATTGLNVDIYLKAGTYSLTLKCDKECTIFLRKGQVTNGYFASTKLTPNTVSNVLTFTYANDEWMRISSFVKNAVFYDFMLVEGTYDADTMPEYSQYNKYKIPVTVKSKNLFNEELLLSSDKVTKVHDGYAVSNYPVAYNSSSALVKHLKSVLKPDTTYTLTRKFTGYTGNSLGNIGIIGPTNVSIGNYKDGVSGKSFTFTQEQIDGIRYVYVYGRNIENPPIFNYIQLEEGETSTNYEPYHEPITTNIYLDEPLRKMGDAEDYIDYRKGKVMRRVIPYILTGDKGFSLYRTNENTVAYCCSLLYPGWTYNSHILCTHFKRIGSVTYDLAGFTSGDASSRVYFRVPIDAEYAQSSTTFQAWVKEQYDNGTPVVIYATPPDGVVEEEIELPTLQTFKGTTVMFVDTAIQPSNIKTKYIRT